MNKHYPLILVFYLDKTLMSQPNIMRPFADSVSEMITKKEANIMAFFMPTDGEERLECINPVTVKEADMEKIMSIMEDIKKNFDVNPDIKVPIEEITLDDKPCECAKNPDGNCECN